MMKTVVLAAALLAAGPAQATIFWSNFDVGTVVSRTAGGAFPRIERIPVEAHDNGRARVGVNAAYFYDTSFEFTVDNSFVADRAIMALEFAGSFGGQRIGFSVSERDDLTGVFSGLGSLQVQANGLLNRDAPGVYEVDQAFGTNFTSEERLFEFRPIQFTAGRTYRIRGAHAAGAGGVTNWYLSDTVAAPGTANQVLRGGSSGNGTFGLDFQPTLALTDGGALVPLQNAVPEPESWALMILGFGAVGAAMRRRRVVVAVA